ncbi:hydrophobic surface binding protein [Mycena leptocephala]|nr:hydrophobic surface binding protein [Mycena leptocephala]
MVQLSRLIFSLSLLAAVVATPVKRTVAQIEADIANIASQVATLDNDIKAFPGSGLVGALGIHSATVTLQSTLNTGTSDVKATALVSESDATTIIHSVEAFEPTILDALSQIAAKKADFAALPVGGFSVLVLQDLKNLNISTNAFSTALIAAAPADLKTEVMTTVNNIDARFASAIAAFS